MAMIEVAFTHYPRGGEVTQWVTMPAVPSVGDTVHLPVGVGGGDSKAFSVRHVSWTNDHPDHPGWHAEISLSD